MPTPVEAIAVASSTGGPQALKIVLAGLRDARPVPIFITQHIRPSFTAMLAGQLEDAIGRPCTEGVDREPVQREGVYLAPGRHHMLVQAGRGGPVLRVSNEAPVHYCRPAADPMLASIAAVYRARSLAIVLTGIGEDGLAGCAAVRAAGGGVIVQDEGSSVVWGNARRRRTAGARTVGNIVAIGVAVEPTPRRLRTHGRRLCRCVRMACHDVRVASR